MPSRSLPLDTWSLPGWAEWYALHGWPVFPCHGKRPVTRHGLKDATTDLAQVQSWWTQWPEANIGSPLGETRWALDVDARHEGLETLHALERLHGDLPRTITSLTGSGGGSQHQIWAIGHTPIVNKADLGPGLDIQGPGSYIILPPSIHPDTKQPYCWEADFGPDDLDPQVPPVWLEHLVTQAHSRSLSATTTTVDGPIPEGQRENTLIQLAGAMRRYGATGAAIRAALDAENQRCIPPLASGDLDRLAHSIERYTPVATVSIGTQAPVGWSSNGGTEHPLAVNWRQDLSTKKVNNDIQVVYSYFNVSQILRFHDYWQREENALWFDSIRGWYMCGDVQIRKSLLIKISRWFGGQKDIHLHMTKLDILRDCLCEICEDHPRDLLQHWLQQLPPWDQVPRLDSWLHDVASVEDSAYSRDISRLLPVSMVARALDPGCQYRYVVILEGQENTGKSTLVRTLATPAWYYAMKSDFESKEAHMELQGAWLVELPELDSLNRTGETRLKAFITLLDDSWIPKYANDRTTVKRRSIFVGTLNPEDPYLKGQTGNTRFLPIQTGIIRPQALTVIRDQLFAEALRYYQGHLTTWWEFTEESLLTVDEERERRRVTTPFEDLLGTYLLTPLPATFPPQYLTYITWQSIAEQILKIESPERWKDKMLQMDIARSMRALGWQNIKRRRNGGPPLWAWESPPGWGEEVPF